jgi:hypothetical protein
LIQVVTVVTGAERAAIGVLAAMGAAAVVLLTAANDLHLNAYRVEMNSLNGAS